MLLYHVNQSLGLVHSLRSKWPVRYRCLEWCVRTNVYRERCVRKDVEAGLEEEEEEEEEWVVIRELEGGWLMTSAMPRGRWFTSTYPD
jgi:hypothetical protein